MKSHLLYLRQSPLRLSILLGFVGLEVLDLAEMFAMHWVPRETAFLVQVATGLLSLTIVGICVYLLLTDTSLQVSRNGRSAGHRSNANMQAKTMFSEIRARSQSFLAKDRSSRRLSELDEQILSLP